MANLRTVQQYQWHASRALGRVYGKPGATVTLAVTTASAATPASGAGSLSPGVHYYVFASADCFIKVAATATTVDMPIPAKVPMVFIFGADGAGGTLQVAAITASGSGTLYFTRMDEVDNP